jgi:acetolactate synthase-1/2/3 large subunit
MILAVGQIERRHRGRQAFQEVDYRAVFGTQAKLVVEIDDADRIPEIVARAVDVATSGRPGPVVLALPEDMLYDETAAAPLPAPVRSGPGATDADRVRLLAALAAAERPLIVAGGPTWSQDAADALRRFAEANDVPVTTAFRDQDAIDNRSSAYAGYLGLSSSARMRELADSSDLIVALGSRLDDPTTDGFELTPPGRPGRVMVVTDDPFEATQALIPTDVILCRGDALATALDGSILPASAARSAWLAELRATRDAHRVHPDADFPVDLAAIIAHIRDTTPDDTIVTNGAGNYTAWLQRFFEFRRWGTQIAPHNGAMGYGLPAALGALAVRPGTRVIAFAGDGCFQMAGMELATAVQEQLPVIVVVIDNGMYGTIRMHQELRFPGRPIATALGDPDFVLFAQAFGVPAHRVESTAEFAPAWAAALATDGPVLIHVRADPTRLTPDRRLDPGATS